MVHLDLAVPNIRGPSMDPNMDPKGWGSLAWEGLEVGVWMFLVIWGGPPCGRLHKKTPTIFASMSLIFGNSRIRPATWLFV